MRPIRYSGTVPRAHILGLARPDPEHVTGYSRWSRSRLAERLDGHRRKTPLVAPLLGALGSAAGRSDPSVAYIDWRSLLESDVPRRR